MQGPVGELIDRISEGGLALIMASSVLNWVAEIGERRNIPVASVWTESPRVFLAYHQFDYEDDDLSGEKAESLAFLPKVTSSHFSEIKYALSSKSIIQKYKQAFSWFTKAQSLIFTSFYELDPHIINTLKSNLSTPIYTLGPSIPYTTLNTDTNDSYIKYLDSKPINSIIYISLGSFQQISDAQMTEMALGLRKSNVDFLWVARGNTEKIEKEVGSNGLIVNWCDQLRAVCHSAVGGFLTHCGWNSILEAVFAGVLSFDPGSISEHEIGCHDWKIGLRLKDEVEDGVVKSEKIAKIVSGLMESEELRKRGKEFKGRCEKALEDGGSFSRKLDEFVEGICNDA